MTVITLLLILLGSQNSFSEGSLKFVALSDYISEYGTLYVVGEVFNNGDIPLKFVQISLTYYDSANNVVDTGFTFLELDTIHPGQKAPFRTAVTESGIIRNIDNYQATFTDARVTVDKPNVLTVMNHNKFVSEYGTLNVVGEIENSGSATSHFTKVIATFYDVKGEIIDTSFTFTEPNDIMSNMIANFKIRQSDLVDEISSYSLTVESREFADSSIIKVAPQPEPRKRVPTEKISLSNMQVVDQLGTRIK